MGVSLSSTSKLRIGEQLIAAGLLTSEGLEKGLALQREEQGFLLDVLLAHRLVEERKVLHFLAEASGARYITTDKLASLKITPEVLDRVPARHAEKLQVLPLAYDAATKTLTLAVSEIDGGLIEQVRLAASVLKITPIVAARASIHAGIKRFYYSDIYAFSWLQEEGARAIVAKQPQGKVLAREDSKVTRQPEREGGTGTQVMFVPAAPVTEVLAEATSAREDEAAELKASEAKAAETIDRLKDETGKLKRELNLLRVANELNKHLARERDESAILYRVMAFAFDNLPADDGVLLTLDRETNTLTPKAVRTRRGEQSDVVISETLLQEVLATRQGVLTGDAQADERFRRSESVVSAGMRSAMGVPIEVDGEVRGLLFLATRARMDVFSEQDLQLLMAIAGQAALTLQNASLSRRITAETASRAHLARFLSPALVEQAARGVVNLGGGGEIQEATILFADIRGFTEMSEAHSPKAVVSMLNEHFEEMVEIVFAHGGVLDKFIGDALMAIWGVPLSRQDDPSRAVRAALEMMERVNAANVRREAAGRVPLRIGIGINTGPVVFGAIGSTRRLEFTAIGDAVNIASRLCGRAEPQQVVASESTIKGTFGGFLTSPLPEQKLKGKSQAIQAFAVQSERTLGETKT